MLFPKKVKYRKHQRRIKAKIATKGHILSFGKFGIKALESGKLTSRQIEAARRAITRYIKREGQVWIRVFPDKAYTARPPETGMGGGKGTVEYYAAPVQKGKIIFELDGIEREQAREALRLGINKLPIKCKIVEKEE